MRRRLALAMLLVVLALPTGVASAQGNTMDVTLDQTRITTSIGQVLTIDAQVVNRTGATSGAMLAHVNVASADGTYVDLEDWSTSVTQPVAPLEPGGSRPVSFELQAVNAGNFHVYIVLLPESGPLVASPSSHVEVTEQRTLNAGGALPVAILVPTLLGLVAAGVRYRVRRRTA